MSGSPRVARPYGASCGRLAAHGRTVRLGALLAVLCLVAAACGGVKSSTAAPQGSAAAPATLRLGYFANLTHAPALVGVESGRIQNALGSATKLEPKIFNAGPAAVEAILSDSIDASFVGPNPALTAYLTSEGEAIRVVAGAASGGASLVVKPGIKKPDDLKGRKLATPQRGNTQDIALRTWLKEHGLNTTLEGGGDVSILPQENAQTLDTFKAGQIDGAWVPEPWATRLVQEGGGTVLVDERDIWPNKLFTTTLLMVRTDFLRAHPDTVAALIRGEVETIDFLNANPAEGRKQVNAAIRKITTKALSEPTIAAAWDKLSFTWDPVAASVAKSAKHAKDVGLLPKGDADIAKLFDLGPLNGQLKTAGKTEVAAT